MKLLETKSELTINELLRIAYEYGNDSADMPADSETVEKEFNEWVESSQNLIKKLILPLVVGRSEQLSCSTCKFLKRTDDYCDTCFKFEKHEQAT